MQHQRCDRHRIKLIIDRHHAKIAAVGVACGASLNVFGLDTNADLHRGVADMVDARKAQRKSPAHQHKSAL